MSEIVLYAKNTRIADSSGNAVPVGARPVVRWREKVSFEIRLPNNASFPAGYYRYAFDYDRDFLNTHPCNAGECTLSEGKLTFDVVFNSLRQAKSTNGRIKPIPFFIQISTLEDEYSEYVIDDAIWVAGCVWDGRAAPAEPAADYYTKEELDRLIDCKIDAPEEPGETGYVLGLAEDGSTAWVPQTGGHGDVAWEDITDKPEFADVAISGSYNDLSGKPSIPAAQQQADWNETSSSSKAFIKNKPTIPTSSDYIPQTDKAAANGVATLDANAIVPNNQLARAITTIPAATSAYTLSDGCFEHTPSAAPTYALPAVTDATRTHWIILTVKFSSTQTIAFEDAQGTTIVPLDTLTITANDVVEYICQYDVLQSKWVISCGKLKS